LEERRLYTFAFYFNDAKQYESKFEIDPGSDFVFGGGIIKQSSLGRSRWMP
jgi:hypothetical protein